MKALLVLILMVFGVYRARALCRSHSTSQCVDSVELLSVVVIRCLNDYTIPATEGERRRCCGEPKRLLQPICPCHVPVDPNKAL
jgi:hypothetical protein